MTQVPSEYSPEAWQFWEALLELSGYRIDDWGHERDLGEIFNGMPVDRFEHIERVAGALIEWLEAVQTMARERQPLSLSAARIGRETG